MSNQFFKSALPVWIEGREKEWNVSAEVTYSARNLKNATLTIAGASFYQVYLGERLLHFGPARKALGYAGVDVVPIPDVDEGRISIRVAGYYLPCFNGVLTPSFVRAEIEQGGEILAATGKHGFVGRLYTPKLQKVMRYSKQRQFTECYDLTKAPVEATFAVVDPEVRYIARGVDLPDLDAKAASFLKAAPFALLDEPTRNSQPFQRDPGDANPHQFYVAELESRPYVEYLKMIPDYSSPCQRGAKNTVEHWKFSKIEAGFLTLRVTAAADTRIIVIFAEQDAPDGRPYPFRSAATNALEWRLSAGQHELYSFEPYTFLGLEIMIMEGECSIERVGVAELAYSARKIKPFEVKDPELALVYQAAIDSFRHNAVDIFMDCPSRERAGWLCDSYYEGMAEYYFTGKTTVEDEFLNNYLLGGARSDLGGMLHMCYPSTAKNHIPQWSLWYVLELYDYFTKRGRGDRKDAFKAQLYTLLDYFKRFENELGLLEKLPGWNFIEWSQLNQRVHDVSWPTNMIYSEAVECIGKIYGDGALIEKAAGLRKTINEMAWNGKMFLDRAMRQEDGTLKNTDELSETTQYYAFRYGVADINEARCAYLKDMILNVFGKDVMAQRYPEIEPSNSLPGFYIRTELMLRWEMYPELVEYIKHFFLPMAKATGTLWENRTPGASCNHGFASYIAIAIEQIQSKGKAEA